MTVSKKDLFERLVTLETDKLTLAEDVKQLKDDAKYHEDNNPKGLSKEDIKNIHSAAKLHAKANYVEFRDKAKAVFEVYEELVGDE